MSLQSRIFLFLSASLCLWSACVLAAQNPGLDYESFKRLPVLDGGRVKPLDSFARIRLREFSGRDAINGLGSAEWLAEVLFDPPQAAERQIFYIGDPGLRERLTLPPGRKYYALPELQDALERNKDQIIPLLEDPGNDLTPAQKQILQLEKNVESFSKLLRSLSLLLPLNIELPKAYAKQKFKEPPDYLDFLASEPRLMKDIRTLIRKKGKNPDRYTDDEKKQAALAFGLQQIRAGGENNDEFRVIPSTGGELVSPWQIALEGRGSPESASSLQQWKDLARAYRAGDAAVWAKATHRFSPPSFLFDLEIFYNRFQPFYVALVFYVLSAALLVLGKIRPCAFLKSGPGAFGLTVLALACHVFGIASRVLILGRPPVGTLYEAVLFVSALCGFLALGFYARKKDTGIFLAGTLAAAALLATAPATLQQGESMEMLVAVLNTNFWLAFHVLCITTGYAASIFTAVLAHVWLVSKARGLKTETLSGTIYVFSLAALFFTALGTALGGIWADQSWGRFWGWDPKENGALLIVLWLAWLQHGRIGRKLGSSGFISGLAFLNVVVALAWFGVNLLGTGLHSYGFTSGIALGLLTFCVAEVFIIGILWFLAAGSSDVKTAKLLKGGPDVA